jgi:hypothetical protein
MLESGQWVITLKKKRPMNKQSYKKAALEHGDFQSPCSNSTPRRIGYGTCISIYGRNRLGQNNAYFKYGLSWNIIPKALVPEVIAVPEKLLLLIYFQMCSEPSSIPEENSWRAYLNCKTVIVGVAEK